MVKNLLSKQLSPYDVKETADKVQRLLEAKQIRLFARINHSQAAQELGLTLSDEELLVFGDPKVGTYLMQEQAEVGIELPLKILVWQVAGKTWIGYRDPLHSLKDYHIKEHWNIVEKMSQLMAKIVSEAIGNDTNSAKS